MFSATSKHEASADLHFSLDDDAIIGGEDDDDLINSPPSQCSNLELFQNTSAIKKSFKDKKM